MKRIAAALMLLVPGLAAAQVNKCIDAAGKVVAYGSQCPAGTRAEQTNIRNAPADTSSAAKSIAERDAEFRKRQMERQEAEAKAAKSSAEAEQRKRSCEQSQAYLKSLQGGQRIRTTDPKTGERSYLPDTEIPKEIERTQKQIASNCK